MCERHPLSGGGRTELTELNVGRLGKVTDSQNSPPPPPPDSGASSGSPAVASASSEHDAGEAPAKKPWRRPTFYILTDVIESHGAPNGKTEAHENESLPPTSQAKNKSYQPATA